MIRALLTGAIGTVALVGVPAVASASSATPAETAGSMQVMACSYRVNSNGVNVRFGPGTSYGVYKVVNAGAIVTGPCQQVWGEGRWWTRLYKASGGFVYIASQYVSPA